MVVVVSVTVEVPKLTAWLMAIGERSVQMNEERRSGMQGRGVSTYLSSIIIVKQKTIFK